MAENSGPSKRRSIWIPDALWRRVQKVAREESIKEGRTVTAGEFVRRALEDLLRRLGGG